MGSELGVLDLSRLEHYRQEGTWSSLGDSWSFQVCPIVGPHLGPSESDLQVMGQWLLLIPSQHALLCAWSCERCALPPPGPDILYFSLGRSKLCKTQGIFCGFWGGPSEVERIALGDTRRLAHNHILSGRMTRALSVRTGL